MRTAWTIATNTLGEALRKRILNIFLLVAIGLIFLSQAFAFFAATQAGPRDPERVELFVINGLAFAVIWLAGLAMSIFLGMDLVPTEVEKRTIYTILSKPVPRWAYITGKFLGIALTLLVNMALMGVVFLIVVGIKTHQVRWELALGVLVMYLEFVFLGAVALFFSVLVTKNINIALSFFFFILGNLSDFWESVVKLNVERFVDARTPEGQNLIQNVVKIVHYVIPNFGNFNVHNPIIHSELIRNNPDFYMAIGRVLLYGVIYSLALLLLTVGIFNRKEV